MNRNNKSKNNSVHIFTIQEEDFALDLSPESGKQVEGLCLDEDSSTHDTAPSEHWASLWSDEHGNLKFVNAVVRCPCFIFFSLLLACMVITVLLLVVIVAQGNNPFSNPENESDLDHITSISFDSLRLAQEEVEESREHSQGATTIRPQSETADITYWVFESQTPNGAFGSREAIANMKEALDLFVKHDEYQHYCVLKYDINGENAVCDLPLTSLTMYYAAEWDEPLVDQVLTQFRYPGNVDLFNNLTRCYYTQTSAACNGSGKDNVSQEDLVWALDLDAQIQNITQHWDMSGDLVPNITQATELAAYLMNIAIYKGLIDFSFDKQFSIDNLVSRYSRSIVLWGEPLGNTTALTADDRDDQEKEDDDQRKDYVVDNFLKEMNRLAKGKTHKEINTYYFMIALIFEVLLDTIQQDGMLAIFSLVFVFLWLRVNTRSWFLSGVGILEIFFSIPMAWFIFSVIFQIQYFAFLNALSIFIVAAIGADDIFIFVDAYKQSKYRNPEILTSLETRMTWVYRRTGQAMAITSATTCAAFLCTLITPLVSIRSFGIFAAVVILMDYILVMTLFCTSVVIYHDRFEDRSRFGCCFTDCTRSDPSPTAIAKDALESGEATEHGDTVGEFFRNRVAGFLLTSWHRLLIGVVFFSWIAVAIWQTTELHAIRKAEQYLDEDHPLQKAFTILENEFPVANDDIALRVYFSWGLGQVDRSGVRLLYDPEFYGEPVFLDSFEFNEQCQTAMVGACEMLKTDPRYHGLIKQINGVGRAFCFIEELAAYHVRGDLLDCDYVHEGGWKNDSWQIPPEDLVSVMPGFLQQQSCVESSETISSFYSNDLGWDGGTMRYAAISVESEKLQPFSTEPESFTRSEYDQFVALAQELEGMVSPSCQHSEVLMTDLDGIFTFMNNQAIFVRTAIQSSLLGVSIAFVMLLFATRVLHLALLASVSIACVLISVVGTMVLQGWELGSIESILIGIIAGFSVDYVVHLAHAYESAGGDPRARIMSAFGDMGISVWNGMITSVAASVPLFFCQLQFFSKFGVFLCTTIAFSWLFANFGFMSLLATLQIPIPRQKGWRW